MGASVAAIAVANAFVGAACAGVQDAASDPSADSATSPAGAEVLESRFGASWPNTDFTKSAIGPDELTSGGPSKDGIPAIDQPALVSIDEAAGFLADDEPVIALQANGEARAYPIQILIWHEIVNDVVGGVPLTVTYCPLCNSAVAFERELNGTLYDFGVSGLLRNSDLVMYDRQTESWWQQFTGEAIVGELVGSVLRFVPSATVSFADFKATYPRGGVLSQETGYDRDYGRNPYVRYDSTSSPFLFDGHVDVRLQAAERVVAVELNGETVAYPFSVLEERIVIADMVGATDIVVFFQPGTRSALDASNIIDSRDVGASGVFAPVANGRTLTFQPDGDRIVDAETMSTWNVLGVATEGPLKGTELERIVHGDHFWFAWAAFKPDTRIWSS